MVQTSLAINIFHLDLIYFPFVKHLPITSSLDLLWLSSNGDGMLWESWSLSVLDHLFSGGEVILHGLYVSEVMNPLEISPLGVDFCLVLCHC